MSRRSLLFLVLVVGLVGWVYSSTFAWLYSRYVAADSYYSHGFLIPLVSGYLVWRQRSALRAMEPEYSRLGAWVLVASLGLHLMGTVIHVFFVSGLSLFLFLLGSCLFVFGEKITKKILFPLLFMIFMIPLPLPIISAVLYPMKVFVVTTSSQIVRWMGIPLFVEGFNVTMAKGSLVIGNPCSGLRSLISYMAMGAVIAYGVGGSTGKSASIFLFSIPVAFLMNILRTVFLMVLAHGWGTEVARAGKVGHDTSGFVVFVIGLILLMWFAGFVGAQDRK